MLHLNPYVHTVLPRSVRLLLALILVLFVGVAITTPAGAQTEAPPIVVTTTPAPDGEPTPIPTEIPVDPDVVSAVTIDRLASLLETVLDQGGAEALIASLPLWGLVALVVGIAIGFVLTRLTPTQTDDAIFERLLQRGLGWLSANAGAVLGALGLRLIVNTPPPPAEGGTVTTTTKMESQTVQTPPDDEHTVGGARPPGFENWPRN